MEMSRKTNRTAAVLQSVIVLAATISWTAASADGTQSSYTMTALVDAAHGHKIVAGKYETAVAKITAKKRSADRYADNTNLCVAYTKMGDIDNASAACEAAVATMRKRAYGKRSNFLTAYQLREYRVQLAMALSNLGVLDAVKGEYAVAKSRFEEALALDVGISAPKVNLARLGRS